MSVVDRWMSVVMAIRSAYGGACAIGCVMSIYTSSNNTHTARVAVVGIVIVIIVVVVGVPVVNISFWFSLYTESAVAVLPPPTPPLSQNIATTRSGRVAYNSCNNFSATILVPTIISVLDCLRILTCNFFSQKITSIL